MSSFWDGFEKQAGAARADRLLKALRKKPALLPTAHKAVRTLDLKNQMRGLAPAETAAKAALEKAKKVVE